MTKYRYLSKGFPGQPVLTIPHRITQLRLSGSLKLSGSPNRPVVRDTLNFKI